MFRNLPKTITVFAEQSGSHLQGIAIDEKREYLYCSFTTCLLKTDLKGNILGCVKGLAGHLGCIAYNPLDGMVYGSLEFKNDSIGQGILKNIGYTEALADGFYIARFDVKRLDRLDMDAETDHIMQAVFLREVYQDYAADGHRYGCSGIDGITFAPSIGEDGNANCLYVAYGIYGDTERTDNDYQVILKYDISHLDSYAQPLNQRSMHRCGPEIPDGKYFVYTGNTTYGIQNLEYDRFSGTMLAAVYRGKKAQFSNYSMFFIDCTQKPDPEVLKGIGETGTVVPLRAPGSTNCRNEIWGSMFPHGSTGMISLGEGCLYIAEPFKNEAGYGGVIRLYRLNREQLTFEIM